MDIDEKKIKDLISRGEDQEILAAFEALQKDVDEKDLLIEKYIVDNGTLRMQYKDLEVELDRLRRVFGALKEAAASLGVGDRVAEIEERLGLKRDEDEPELLESP